MCLCPQNNERVSSEGCKMIHFGHVCRSGDWTAETMGGSKGETRGPGWEAKSEDGRDRIQEWRK